MKILILVAIEDELKRTDLPNLQIEYIGVGKVNAAFNTLKAIQKYSPEKVINFFSLIELSISIFSNFAL